MAKQHWMMGGYRYTRGGTISPRGGNTGRTCGRCGQLMLLVLLVVVVIVVLVGGRVSRGNAWG